MLIYIDRIAALLAENKMSKMTRTEYMYSRRKPYSAITKAIREGKISVYLIYDKVMIETEEADEYFRKKATAKVPVLRDLFA
jgi:hypothetical protein